MSSEASPPRDRDDRERSRLERIVPELVKKLLDVGVEKISEGPENLRQLLSEMKLPREAILLLVAQLDETKKDVTRAIARELRDFLEKASLAEEFNKLLSGLSLEIKTQIRFVPNAAASGRTKPEVKTKIGVQQIDPSTQAEEPVTRTETGIAPDPSPENHQNSVAEQESSK
ncbi:MAG TPA: hypothetical protein VIV60_22050 [Polyangiaceae bacterium]